MSTELATNVWLDLFVDLLPIYSASSQDCKVKHTASSLASFPHLNSMRNRLGGEKVTALTSTYGCVAIFRGAKSLPFLEIHYYTISVLFICSPSVQ